MPKWEYATVSRYYRQTLDYSIWVRLPGVEAEQIISKDAERSSEILNDLGAQGWELVDRSATRSLAGGDGESSVVGWLWTLKRECP